MTQLVVRIYSHSNGTPRAVVESFTEWLANSPRVKAWFRSAFRRAGLNEAVEFRGAPVTSPDDFLDPKTAAKRHKHPTKPFGVKRLVVKFHIDVSDQLGRAPGSPDALHSFFANQTDRHLIEETLNKFGLNYTGDSKRDDLKFEIMPTPDARRNQRRQKKKSA